MKDEGQKSTTPKPRHFLVKLRNTFLWTAWVGLWVTAMGTAFGLFWLPDHTAAMINVVAGGLCGGVIGLSAAASLHYWVVSLDLEK